MALTLRARVSLRILSSHIRCMSQTGQWGEGAGKGGGTGGTIRDAGGAFGKREAAEEEWYFKKLVMEMESILICRTLDFHYLNFKQQEQLKKMRERSEEEVDYHAKQISMHKEAIDRHKKKISQIKHEEDDDSKDRKK